jgi:UV DNA damage endonuclease
LFDLNENIAKDDDYLLAHFAHAGKLFKENAIRVTTHPGQYTLLSSDNESVITRAITDLAYHAWMFDCMGLEQTPYAAINIHGGKSARTEKLIQTILSLPGNIRSRLTLENDESAYSLADLLPVHAVTAVPIVWDSHHHQFNDGGLSSDEAFSVALSTWKNTGCKPLQHLSNTAPGLKNSNFADRRKHSDFIHTIPQCQLTGLRQDLTDVDIEAKMKNLAIIALQAKLKNSYY